MTIPTVLSHYREQEVISKVKKFYSTFSSAIQLAISENGTIDTWDIAPKSGNYDATSAEKFANYLKPYLKVMTDCGTDTDNECMDDSQYKYLNGGDAYQYGTISGQYRMILADGSTIMLRATGKSTSDEVGYGYIFVDINGKNTPNQFGKDFFIVSVLENGLTPGQVDMGYTDDDNCTLKKSGHSCLKYILEYGNMNYLKG